MTYSPLGETVTFYAQVAGAADRYGVPAYTWPTGVAVAGVLVAPGKSSEGSETIREDVDTACTLYRLPYGVTVGPYDRVVVRGETWQVAGNPARWSNGEWSPGSVLELTRTEG